MSKRDRKKIKQLRRDVDLLLNVISEIVTQEMARRVREGDSTVLRTVPDEPNVE